MRFIKLLLFILFIKSSQAQHSSVELLVTISDVRATVTIDGKEWAYYEMYVFNSSTQSVRITNIDIINNETSVNILHLNGDSIQLNISNITRNNEIPPQSNAIVYIEITIPKKSIPLARPLALKHQVSYTKGSDGITKRTEVRTMIKNAKPVLIGPPLGEGNWAAIYDPRWTRGHRRVVFTINDTTRIPGRFAIDFMMLDDSGRYSNHESDSIKNWYGYSADILAVSNGLIVSAIDTFVESNTLSGHPDYDSSRATGNYISLKCGANIYAFYEHLKPGSLRVKAGDSVKAGQVIASIGFTGQSTGPHLHFHVANRNSPLGAEGIPFVFKQFKYAGRYRDFQNFGLQRWDASEHAGKTINDSRPASNSVIQFTH